MEERNGVNQEKNKTSDLLPDILQTENCQEFIKVGTKGGNVDMDGSIGRVRSSCAATAMDGRSSIDSSGWGRFQIRQVDENQSSSNTSSRVSLNLRVLPKSFFL